MVMRHGNLRASEPDIKSDPLTPKSVRISGNKLGCYFCNDVVAPGNVGVLIVYNIQICFFVFHVYFT